MALLLETESLRIGIGFGSWALADQVRHLPSQFPVYTFLLEPASDGDFLHFF